MSVNTNFKVDLNDLYKDILSRVQQMGRAEAMQMVRDEFSHNAPEGYNVLVVSLSQQQRCKYKFKNELVPQSHSWIQGFDRHDFRVHVFTEGFFNHQTEDGGYTNWAFTNGFRYPLPRFNLVHPRDDRQYVVWAKRTDTLGRAQDGRDYAMYWHDRQVRRITVKLDYNKNWRAHLVAAIMIQYDDDYEEIGKNQREQKVLNLSPNEKIVGVSVRSGGVIDAIKFRLMNSYTNQERESEWMGGNGGTVHHFRETAKGIFGQCNKYVNNLGIFY